jgi:hypothetical protein
VLGHDREPASADAPASILARQLLRAVAEAPPTELPTLVGALAQAQAVALARLTTPRPEDHRAEVRDGNISVEDAARRLGVSPSYIHKNAKSLPFVVKIGRRRVCSTSRLEKWNRGRLGS